MIKFIVKIKFNYLNISNWLIIFTEFFSGFAINIGFCDEQFPLENKVLGFENNSIGIGLKRGGIWIDGSDEKFENVDEDEYFSDGDCVGIGIIHHYPNGKMQCFATCNGKYLGKINFKIKINNNSNSGKSKLPTKFANIQLFPAITLYDIGDSVRVNFGKDKWQFKEFGCVLGWENWEMMKRKWR